MYLYLKFQTAITGAILVQSLRDKDFYFKTNNLSKHVLNCTPTTVTDLLQSDGIFILFQSETPLLAVNHFVYHLMLIHQRNRQNMAKSSVKTRIQFEEVVFH